MTDHDNLHWTAFRYAAGEMPADEAAAFEAQLGSDQSAREALAGAVELAQAVDLAYLTAECVVPSPVVEKKQLPARIRWARPLAWMGAGAALCLAAVVVVLATSNPSPQHTEVTPPVGENDSRALASAWLDAEGMRSELSSLTAFAADLLPDAYSVDSYNGDSYNGDDESGDASANETLNDESLGDGDEFVLPAWMLAAVSADEMPDAGDPIQEN